MPKAASRKMFLALSDLRYLVVASVGTLAFPAVTRGSPRQQSAEFRTLLVGTMVVSFDEAMEIPK